jgi:hypothetical protein
MFRLLLLGVIATALCFVAFIPVACAQRGDNFPSSIAAFADFNGDGKMDVVFLAQPGAAMEFGNGDGTFGPGGAAFDSPTRNACGSAAAADFNGDGMPDIVLQCGEQVYLLYLGNGDGTFQTPVQFADPPLFASALLVVDFNNDGHKDLLAAGAKYQNVPSLAVLNNNGSGQFTLGLTRTPGWVVAAPGGDVNGDHIPDIVVTLH